MIGGGGGTVVVVVVVVEVVVDVGEVSVVVSYEVVSSSSISYEGVALGVSGTNFSSTEIAVAVKGILKR